MTVSRISYNEDHRIRLFSAIGSIILHLIIIIILSLVSLWKPKQLELIELDWGSSSGAPNQAISNTENEPKNEKEITGATSSPEKSKVDLPNMKSQSETTIPVPKVTRKPANDVKNETVVSQTATKVRQRRTRDGAAGGSGKSTGYSIEWSGVGSRRLISGRIPVYPEGTDKEMPVVLQFTVLPDGSVSSIIPLKRSDEILEQEAISALRTWRFDPLPPHFEQVSQIGKVTFIFKLI